MKFSGVSDIGVFQERENMDNSVEKSFFEALTGLHAAMAKTAPEAQVALELCKAQNAVILAMLEGVAPLMSSSVRNSLASGLSTVAASTDPNSAGLELLKQSIATINAA
jgi:hypothetical protein